METTIGDATCIIDRDGIIVWASPDFIGLFSHRATPIGMPFNHLFSGLTDVCRHGMPLEDRDRAGRRRYFRAECRRESNVRGDRVSDVVVLRNVTLMKVLSDISRLATQTVTPKELYDKALPVIKDSCGYLGMAGFVSRGSNIELIASKGWTEKLKSMVRIVPVAPDAPAMSGRCAYYRTQMVTTIEEYGLLKSVKDAIERIGGEFVVVTPLVDHERLVGVLAVIHDRALSPEELDTLQTICGQLAVSLDVRMQAEAISRRAEGASLFLDLLSHEIALHESIIRAWAEDPGDEEARERALKALALDDEIILDLRNVSTAEDVTRHTLPLATAVEQAVEDGRLLAGHSGRKIDVTLKLADGSAVVGVLLRYALRNLIANSVKHARSGSVDVTVRASVDRLGARKIEVSDNGPGVPDEMKSVVFRLEGRPASGTGLYLVKRIVSRYGGRIWIEDRVPGNPAKGARMVIILPPDVQGH
ncbi:MAG TPA: ATP-binding protein [Methanocella sp.]|jgi:signal transduction histidine kinase